MDTGLKNFISRSTLFFVGLTAIIVLTVKIWPASELMLFREDGIIEDGTATVDALAAMMGFYAIYWGVLRGRQALERTILWVIPLLSLFCFLDEISWGARLFDIQMPAMKGGGEFDGVHDIFTILERQVAALTPPMFIAALAFTISIMAALIYWQRKLIVSYIEYAAGNTLGRCLACAVFLLMLATALDFGHGRMISSLEEFSELSAGLFMLFAAATSLRMGYVTVTPAKEYAVPPGLQTPD